MRKTWKLALATLLVSLCLLPATAFAAEKNVFDQVPCTGSTASSAACNASGDPITGKNGTLAKVTNVIAFIAGIGAVITMTVGGIMYILSGGNSSKLTAAKDTVLYAAIGLVVVVLARAIALFVINRIK